MNKWRKSIIDNKNKMKRKRYNMFLISLYIWLDKLDPNYNDNLRERSRQETIAQGTYLPLGKVRDGFLVLFISDI